MLIIHSDKRVPGLTPTDKQSINFSLNWIMNNNQEQVEKFIIDIKEYLESMGKVSDNGGIDNGSFGQGVHGQVEMIEISLDDNDDQRKSGDKPVKPVSPPEPYNPIEPEATSRWRINWFDVKMVLIGTVALMFARINGQCNKPSAFIQIFFSFSQPCG